VTALERLRTLIHSSGPPGERTDKTDKTPRPDSDSPENGTDKTDKTGSVGFVSSFSYGRAESRPAGPVQPQADDDRAWIGDILRARDAAAKLAILSEWITATGGETCGRTALLPALRPHNVRRLAEVELRRMCRRAGLEVLEDEP
jgi:hypothetical protein